VVVTASKATRTIKQTRFLPAKALDVYDALLDAGKHAEFTGSKATCEPKVGGKFTAWDGYISGKNLELEKGKRIVQEWKTTEWPRNYPPSVVEFSFRAKGSGTELTMVHSKVPAEQADSYEQGWIDFYWKPLKEYFEMKSKR
jgi:activator of HSP90 ATPase